MSGKKKKSEGETEDSKKNQKWSETETINMLAIWKTPEVQNFFQNHRHSMVWESIAAELNDSGYKRTGPEIKSKIKNLKALYVKKKPKSGEEPPTWIYWDALHQVFSQKDLYDDSNLMDSLNQESNSSENSDDDTKNDLSDSEVAAQAVRSVKKIKRPPRKNKTEISGKRR